MLHEKFLSIIINYRVFNVVMQYQCAFCVTCYLSYKKMRTLCKGGAILGALP